MSKHVHRWECSDPVGGVVVELCEGCGAIRETAGSWPGGRFDDRSKRDNLHLETCKACGRKFTAFKRLDRCEACHITQSEAKYGRSLDRQRVKAQQ